MDATSFQAPQNIKNLFIKDKKEKEKQQYLVVPNSKIDEVYNIYLTNKSPELIDGLLNLDANNLLLINYYKPETSTFSIENLTKNILLQSLDKLFTNISDKIIPSETTPKSLEKEAKLLSPELTKSLVDEKKTTKPSIELGSSIGSSIGPSPDLTKSLVDEKETTKPSIELGSSIGSSPSLSIDSIDNDNDWPDKCNVTLNKRDTNWIKFSYGKDYNIYDVPPDGNCFFYSFIEALKYRLPLDYKRNIKYIPDKILEVLKSLIEINGIIPDDPLIKLQEISNTLPSNMCSKYNLSVLALRYILSLEADTEYFYTYIFRFDSEEEKMAAGIENITTLDEFKKYILTDKYWADEWAISKFQKLFNIQFVIFDESEKELLGCKLTGEIYSNASSEKEIVTIILNWFGNNHYQLVTYNDNAVISFDDLPSIVKDSCIPTTTGGKLNKHKKHKKTKRKYTKQKKYKITKKYNKNPIRKITKKQIKKNIKKSKTKKKK
jgi:hypothetical protein